MSNNAIQPSTIRLVSRFEGLSLVPYHDVANVWTYGYGSTRDLDGKPVTQHTPPLTLEQADKLLGRELQAEGNCVNTVVKVPLTQNQYDACVSLTHNIGQGGFAESTVARMCNAGNFAAAAKAFLLWDKAGGAFSQPLMNRRRTEMALFMSQ